MLGVEYIDNDLELWPQKSDEAWADDFLKKQQRNKDAPLIGVNLGASPFWLTKRWTIEKFAVLFKKIKEDRKEIDYAIYVYYICRKENPDDFSAANSFSRVS